MIQFYFLSIVLNLFSGYALILDGDERTGTPMDGIRELFSDETLRLVLGVLTVSVGFFKLISVVRSDVAIIGDLIPAAAGILSGIALLLEFYRNRSALPNGPYARFDLVLAKNRKWIGYGAIVAAFTHFLFPTVLFL